MKNTLLTLIVFFAFTAFAKAQEEQDKTLRQPTPVTQAQVEKDAQMAKDERKKHEDTKKAVNEEKIKAEDKKKTSNTTNGSQAKKTSTQPGKQ